LVKAKSRRNKSGRNKSRRNKSRRNKSRRLKGGSSPKSAILNRLKELENRSDTFDLGEVLEQANDNKENTKIGNLLEKINKNEDDDEDLFLKVYRIGMGKDRYEDADRLTKNQYDLVEKLIKLL